MAFYGHSVRTACQCRRCERYGVDQERIPWSRKLTPLQCWEIQYSIPWQRSWWSWGSGAGTAFHTHMTCHHTIFIIMLWLVFAQLCLDFYVPMTVATGLPLSGLLQGRMLGVGGLPSSKGSSWSNPGSTAGGFLPQTIRVSPRIL